MDHYRFIDYDAFSYLYWDIEIKAPSTFFKDKSVVKLRAN